MHMCWFGHLKSVLKCPVDIELCVLLLIWIVYTTEPLFNSPLGSTSKTENGKRTRK